MEDVAASGGYFLACGAQEIYVSESSIVGSIGVISQSFGFQVNLIFFTTNGSTSDAINGIVYVNHTEQRHIRPDFLEIWEISSNATLMQ